MTPEQIEQFIAENTMDGYMGEPAVSIEKILELAAKIMAETVERCAVAVEQAEAPDYEDYSGHYAKAVRALSSPPLEQGRKEDAR